MKTPLLILIIYSFIISCNNDSILEIDLNEINNKNCNCWEISHNARIECYKLELEGHNLREKDYYLFIEGDSIFESKNYFDSIVAPAYKKSEKISLHCMKVLSSESIIQCDDIINDLKKKEEEIFEKLVNARNKTDELARKLKKVRN